MFYTKYLVVTMLIIPFLMNSVVRGGSWRRFVA